jgi:hypothetical protein
MTFSELIYIIPNASQIAPNTFGLQMKAEGNG